MRACLLRPRYAAQLIAAGLETSSVAALSAYRPLGGNEHELVEAVGLEDKVNEMEVMEAGLIAAFNLGALTDEQLTTTNTGYDYATTLVRTWQLERFKVTAAGLTAIEKALVPGGRVGDAAVACKAVYEEAGFELAFPLCGHGMGLTLHEEPVIEPNCDVICVPDMMFAAEAVLKIGFDELRLVHSEQYHLESLVRVTESGPHVMASAGKEPVVISAG